MEAILFVEHETALRDEVFRALHRAGYHVLEAATGSRARELLDIVRPSLLLVDLDAPGSAELAVWLAQEPNLASSFVVLLTSFDLQRMPSRTSGVLRKPFHMDALVSLVATLLR